MANTCPQCHKIKPDAGVVFMRPKDVCNCLIDALNAPGNKKARAGKLATAHVAVITAVCKKMILHDQALTAVAVSEIENEIYISYLNLIESIEGELP